MYVKIRNWTGDDLTKKEPGLYKALQRRTRETIKNVYVKCFDYHNCLILDTDNMDCANGLEVLLQIICALCYCDVTVKYHKVTLDWRDQKLREFQGCVPALEIWLNDGSQYSYEVEDYEEDGWFD